MADLKDLKEMAKKGEISKKLLEDEGFKNELKKILEEEGGVEVTDDQIPEIVKEMEESLENEKGVSKADVAQPLDEETLDTVSGGSFKTKVIKGTGALIGANILGGVGARVSGGAILPTVGGFASGAIIGKKLGDLVCDKLGIEK